jgi:hypothetical protein
MSYSIHKLSNSIWNKEECLISGRSILLYHFQREVIKLTVVIIAEISLLSTSYKILSNILLSRLSPYIDEIIGDHQCGFRRNRSTTDQIFCIRQILEKICEYNDSWDSAVGIVTGYGLDDRGVGVRVPVGSRIFSTSSMPAMGPKQPPIQWVLGPLSLGAKRQGREADH